MPKLEELTKPEKANCLIDFQGIRELLPHRYPFLYVDKIISFDDAEKKIVGQKNVTFNEPFFQGHFPEEPVMPGVIQVEAMAQVGCIMLYLAHPEESEGKRPAFMGVDGCRFRRPVRPGDVLRIECTETKWRRSIGTMEAVVYCDDEIVANATLMATMV
jgi:beta-hydroxyacyl-ACP dehydratase FabZ